MGWLSSAAGVSVHCVSTAECIVHTLAQYRPFAAAYAPRSGAEGRGRRGGVKRREERNILRDVCVEWGSVSE